MAHTVRARTEWVQRACKDAGGVTAWAHAIGVDKSTASRQLRGDANAGYAFIGAILAHHPVKFETAFEVIETPA